MACLVSTNDVVVDYPSKRVLDGVSLGINEGDRIGIVGRNGDGKTTLLKVLSGLLEPDSGMVLRNGTPTIGVLGQTDSLDPDASIRDQIQPDSNTPWEAERTAREIVDALLGELDLESAISTLSGGQRRRVDLARLLLGSWDILMLDEPTNHLDVRAISWLAKHLKTRWQDNTGALLVVTHDRWFLDEVCKSMWEVHAGRVLPFEGGYSAYVLQRVERSRLEEQARRKRENQLRKELAWLSRGAQARRSKPKFHLEQAEALIADEPPVRNPIELKRAAMTRLGKQVLELENACVALDDATILNDITWIIGPGDRIGIVGDNGTGKTTLLRLLNGTYQPSAGTIKTGKTVQLATLSQELEELRPVEDDVVRVLCSRYKTYYEVDGKLLSPSALLERIGFTRDELNARVKDLSGGQRRRLALVLTLLEQPNVLLLDEPGNDLDTDMMAATEDLLDTWPGTLVVVSHDRYLLERVADDIYALAGGRLRHLPGGIDEYLHDSTSRLSVSQPLVQTDAHQQEQRMGGAQLHALRKKVASLERKIESQRKRVAEARQVLESADPYDYEQLSQAQANVQTAENALSSLEDEWLEASIALQ